MLSPKRQGFNTWLRVGFAAERAVNIALTFPKKSKACTDAFSRLSAAPPDCSKREDSWKLVESKDASGLISSGRLICFSQVTTPFKRVNPERSLTCGRSAATSASACPSTCGPGLAPGSALHRRRTRSRFYLYPSANRLGSPAARGRYQKFRPES